MQITTIGFDIGKNAFQVHGIEATERVVIRKQLRRSQVMTFFASLSPCLIGMEACAYIASLGARADEAWPRGSPDAGEGREGLCKAL